MLGLTRSTPTPAVPTGASSCRQCGAVQTNPAVTFCRRCGIPFGAPPSAEARLPSCPVCYQTVDDQGLLPPFGGFGARQPISEHLADHDRFPVGDDEWLESLRVGDRIRVGDGWAPFDLVRRYLVTGLVDAGHGRQVLHDAVVTAMSQLARWGNAEVDAFGDQEEWRTARQAVTRLMERYHRDR
jgi:hypothetical protein